MSVTAPITTFILLILRPASPTTAMKLLTSTVLDAMTSIKIRKLMSVHVIPLVLADDEIKHPL